MPAHLPTWTTVGFTGHRKLDDPQRIAAAIRQALDELDAAHRPLAAVTSAASGADTLFLDELARRGTPYFLVLPFASERFRQDFDTADWTRAAAHFDRALSTDEVRDVDTATEAYLDAGVRTVDRADVLLAVWNGRPAADQGGVGEVVAYARALQKPLMLIDAATGAIARERLDQLTPAAASAATELAPGVSPRELVQCQYAEFDAVAEQHAPASRRLIVRIIWLHLIATAVGVTGAALSLPGGIGQSFTVFKLAALSLALFLSSRQRAAHHEWHGARLAAEICRSYLAVWPLRRRGGQLAAQRLDEQDALNRSLRITWLLDRQAELPLDAARDAYIAGRIHDQLDYFRRKYKADGDRAIRLKTVALAATIAAMAFNSAVIGMSWRDMSGPLFTCIKWFSNILGLIPPAVLTYVMGLDLSRRAERFGDATARLEQAEQRLLLARTWPGVWREVADAEEFLMREVVEWYSQTRPRKSR